MFLSGKSIDKSVPVPLYYQLKTMITDEINSGNYEADSLIPTEKEFSDMFGISRTTVRQAITELVQEGWLYRVKSKGTFIAHRKINHDFLQHLETFDQQMTRIGVTPSTEVLDFKVIPASEEVAQNLGLQPGDQVFHLSRRRFGDSNPVVLVSTYLPYERCAFLQDCDFASRSLYACLASHQGTTIYRALRTIEATSATTEDAKYLNIRKGAPIQLFHTIGYTEDDIPLEYSIARYRGDMSSFQVSVFVDNH